MRLNVRNVVPCVMLSLSVGGTVALLTGCSDAITRIPAGEEIPFEVVIESEQISLGVGDSVTLPVQLHAADTVTDRGVTFLSRDPSIVLVTPLSSTEARLQGVKTGRATVVAVSSARPAASDSVRVQVAQILRDPPPTVAITSITEAGTTTKVDTADIHGVVDVHMETIVIDAGMWLRLVAGAGPKVPCGEVPLGQAKQVCTLDTAARDTAGNPGYPNGSYSLMAQIHLPSGVITGTTTWHVTIHNEP